MTEQENEVRLDLAERKVSVPTKHIIDVEKEREENLLKLNSVTLGPRVRRENRKVHCFIFPTIFLI